MPERKRSKDGTRETDSFTGVDAGGSPGRAGGDLARDIGSKDELKRSQEDPAGVTRVRKSDEQERAEKKNSGG